MKIVFLGSKDRGVNCLEALIDAGHEITGVVTAPEEDPNKFWEGSVEETAQDYNIPTLLPEEINRESVVEELRQLDGDLFVMSGYNKILSQAVLDVPPKGVINLHAGRLPDYRGGSPLNWAIINGETEATMTIHYATEAVDAGAILSEESVPIAASDTIREVRERTLQRFPQLLVDVVNQIERGAQKTRDQDITKGAYWGSRRPIDGRIHWARMNERSVYDMVRALTRPYPGAFTMYGEEKVFVWEAERIEETIKHHPGRICMVRDSGRVVAAADRGVLLKVVQPEGGDAQPAEDYLDHGEYLT